MSDTTSERTEPGLRILLFGATGVAGSGVLRVALAAPEVAGVVAFTRTPLEVTHPKLTVVVCRDFADLGPLASHMVGIDACFYCLGISVAQLEEREYRIITMDYALEVARGLKEGSPGALFHFLSGAGAERESGMMWARVKAETEDRLREMMPGGVIVYRPGLILGDRLPGGLSPLYRALYPLLRLLRFLPSLSVTAEAIGRAMLRTTLEGWRQGTLGNRRIRKVAEGRV